jgi:AraC-like DNA-binding protein
MKLTDDNTRCTTLPPWASRLELAGNAHVASFGHTVIIEAGPQHKYRDLPVHDALRIEFSQEENLTKTSSFDEKADEQLAQLYRIGGPRDHLSNKQTSALPSILIVVDKEHLNDIIREHFTSEESPVPQVKAATFYRGTPHGRGLYAMAEALRVMASDGSDILSRYCMEIALIKAIALAPPNMLDLKNVGKTWGPMMRRVEKAAKYLVDHVEEPFNLTSLSKTIGCSTRSLNDAFQTYLNISPLKFHRNCRLEAAFAMLSESDASVTEVAIRFGFENLGRFASSFQERFGYKPSHLRKQ